MNTNHRRNNNMPRVFLNSIAICGLVQFVNLYIYHSPSQFLFPQSSDDDGLFNLGGDRPMRDDPLVSTTNNRYNDSFLRHNNTHSSRNNHPPTTSSSPSKKKKKNRQPDGTFNGIPIYHRNHPPSSKIHCIGENFEGENRSWLFRSCEYTTFCLDLRRQEFVVYPHDPPVPLPDFWWSSTQMHKNLTAVAGGSQPKSWFPVIAHQEKHLKTRIGQYQPRTRYDPKKRPSSYYYLPNATLLPFFRHPASYRNPGHLLWDDLLPLYTLLEMFDRTETKVLPVRMRRPTTSEFEEPIPPFDIFSKFLPLILNHNNNNKNVEASTTTDYQVELDQLGLDQLHLTNADLKKKFNKKHAIICAPHGLTGGGLFSDHGEHRWHGQWPSDRKLPHNMGRGGLLRRFRAFLMQNLGMDPDATVNTKRRRIVVSQSSSSKAWRANLTFGEYIHEMNTTFRDSKRHKDVEVLPVNMTSMSLEEQIQLTSTASVFLTAVGGGSATAMFLPKGAHLVLFYNPNQYLDWDVWNNFPHLNVHWVGMWRTNRTGAMIHTYPKRFVQLIERFLDESSLDQQADDFLDEEEER